MPDLSYVREKLDVAADAVKGAGRSESGCTMRG
jgi:hypothetical protein